MVEKKVASHTSIYTLAPPTAEFLRAIARHSGAHIWLDTEDVFSANQCFVLVHASSAGEKTVSLPGGYDVLDAYRGKLLFNCASQFTVNLPKYANGVYEIRKVEQ